VGCKDGEAGEEGGLFGWGKSWETLSVAGTAPQWGWIVAEKALLKMANTHLPQMVDSLQTT